MIKDVQTPEQKEDYKKNFKFIAAGVIFLYTFVFFGVGGYAAFNFDKITAQNFIEDLGGIDKVAAMSEEKLTKQVNKYFPKIGPEVEYSVWFVKKRENKEDKKIIKINYSLSRYTSGEWSDPQESIYENLKDFLMANVFIEGQREPIEIACFQGKFLFRKN